jgi:sugar phosphate isomerase/epimerase
VTAVAASAGASKAALADDKPVPSKKAQPSPSRKVKSNTICVFTKPFQSLSYDELADRIAALGVDGIEVPVRDKGHIQPAEVPDELPKMVEALKKRRLEITILTSDIHRVDQPHAEATLRTAAKLGIQRYRMRYYRYDLRRPILDQLAEIRPMVKDLVALNHELGISAVYQNHAGPTILGAPLWDLHALIQDYPIAQIGSAFDIRHATVEGGQCWPIQLKLLLPHINAVCVKDFRWDGRRPDNVPLGEGRVDRRFFALLRESDYRAPISLHEEYLDHRDPKLVPEHLAAIRRDLDTLRTWLDA